MFEHTEGIQRILGRRHRPRPGSSTASTLGIEIEDVPPHGLLRLRIEGGNPILVYPKEDHEPASFTILNFPVADVEGTVASLRERGVEFERYEGTQMETDEQGIFRGGGPLIAWFKDPAGNVLSVVEG